MTIVAVFYLLTFGTGTSPLTPDVMNKWQACSVKMQPAWRMWRVELQTKKNCWGCETVPVITPAKLNCIDPDTPAPSKKEDAK